MMVKRHRQRRALVATGTCFALLVALLLVLSSCRSATKTRTSSTTTASSDDQHRTSPFFASPPPTPSIVWLMSMAAHSGSALAVALVSKASGLAMATNYGEDVLPKESDIIHNNVTVTTTTTYFSLSIAPRFAEEGKHSNAGLGGGGGGPYWTGLHSALNPKLRKLPTTSVLVQTHCSDDARLKKSKYKSPYNNDSSNISKSSTELQQFAMDCATTLGKRHRGQSSPSSAMWTRVSYPLSSVQGAVHLIRNPLTQVITKFVKSSRKDETIANDKQSSSSRQDAFRQWCRQYDIDNHEEEEEANENKDEQTKQPEQSLARPPPCHSFVAHYVQWHNLAFETIATSKIPQFVVAYEDLIVNVNGDGTSNNGTVASKSSTEKVQKTVDSILHFLDLPRVDDELPKASFHKENTGIEVDNYLSKEDEEKLGLVVQKLALPQTWEHVRRYFPTL